MQIIQHLKVIVVIPAQDRFRVEYQAGCFLGSLWSESGVNSLIRRWKEGYEGGGVL